MYQELDEQSLAKLCSENNRRAQEELYTRQKEQYLIQIHSRTKRLVITLTICHCVPVRADFTIARNRWLDVYVGAGASADFCVAAYDAGKKIAKDGVGFSLIGAGGVQFNITDNLGIFLDPTLSWNIPSNNRVLDTYKSEHPFMFSVSTGLRVTIPVSSYGSFPVWPSHLAVPLVPVSWMQFPEPAFFASKKFPGV